MNKRIVICADGTWNEPEQVDKTSGRRKPTNVLKVARAVLPQASDGKKQVLMYLVGIGAETPGLDKFTNGGLGTGMERNVRTLYRFLVFNYEPGDELYFFGFSRGAFTVRTLAGFMNAVGLLEKHDEFFTGDLYKLYEAGVRTNSEQWRHAFRYIDKRPPCPPIRFIGVWDTVGALGAPGAVGQLIRKVHDKYQYHDIGLHPTIENVYHALAIDERRRPFLPSLFVRPQGWSGKLEQAWFAGYHSNVGGSEHPDGAANEALHWIVEKAEALGLEFDKQFLAHYLACFNARLHDSMGLIYRLGQVGRTLGEHLADGEHLHQSVLDRMNLAELGYAPENLKAFLARGEPPVVTTTRIKRGEPCPPFEDLPR